MKSGARKAGIARIVVLAGVLGSIMVAAPAAAVRSAGHEPDAAASGQVYGGLTAVAATSARNAWAVGITDDYQMLIMHWDGTVWQQVSSPSAPRGEGGDLFAVAALSVCSAWAVGGTVSVPHSTGGPPLTAVILRWADAKWQKVPTHLPLGPGHESVLYGMTATSARNGWAVGSIAHSLANGSWTSRALIMHWNGTRWQLVPNRLRAQLTAVTATSARNAWAVGANATDTKLVIVHWNGVSWRQVPSPTPTGDGILFSVVATSATNAWAVGWRGPKAPPLILHWTGTRWRRVRPPGLGLPFPTSLAATSPANLWAVGPGIFLHRNGTAWQQVPSP